MATLPPLIDEMIASGPQDQEAQFERVTSVPTPPALQEEYFSASDSQFDNPVMAEDVYFDELDIAEDNYSAGGLLTVEQAAERAVRYNYALGDRSPGPSELTNQILTGREGALREGEYVQRLLEDRERKGALMNEVIQGQGGSATTEDIDFVMSLAQTDLESAIASPGTILEKLATEKLFAQALADPVDDADLESVIIDGGLDKPSSAVEFSLIARRYLENQNAKVQASSWAEFGLNMAQNFIPFLEWARLQNVTGIENDNILLGNNLSEQVQQMYLLTNPDEFESVLKQTIDNLNNSNPLTALLFAQAVVGFTSSDQFLNNLASVGDVTAGGVVSAALGFKLGSKIRGVVASSGARNANQAGQQAAAQTANGAAQIAQGTLVDDALRVASQNPPSWRDMINRVQSIANPVAVLDDPQGILGMTADFAGRLRNTLQRNRDTLLKGVLIDPVRLDRLTPEQKAIAFAEAESLFRNVYNGPGTSILNVRPVNAVETTIGVDAIAVQIGSPSGKLFGSQAQALRYAQQYGLSGIKVKSHNGAFYLETLHYVDESLTSVLQAVRQSLDSQPRPSLLNSFVGWLRTKDDIVPRQLAEDMAVSAVGTKGLLKAARQVRETVEALPGASNDANWLTRFFNRKENRRNFEDFIDYQKNYDGPNGQHGQASRNVGDFSRDWYHFYRRMPTEQEVIAYFSYRQLDDIDWIVRNVGILKDKARIGIRDYALRLPNNSQTGFFEGKILSQFPWERVEDAYVLRWDSTDPTRSELMSKNFAQNGRRIIDDDINVNGRKVIHLSEFGEQELRQFLNANGFQNVLGDRRVTYLLVDDFIDKPLDFAQIPNRPGGHRITVNQFAVRQPTVTFNNRTTRVGGTYYGDRTVFTAATLADAQNFANRLDEARLMLREALNPQSRITEVMVRNYVNQHLPISYGDFRAMFVPNARAGANDLQLDIDTPIWATPLNQSTWNAVNLQAATDRTTGRPLWPNLRNNRMSGHNLYAGAVDLEFAMERGQTLRNVVNRGSMENPVFGIESGTTLDALGSMDRSVSSLMRGRILDDMKRKSTRDFVELFADVLEGDITKMRRDPVAALLNPQWKKTLTGEQKLVLGAAKDYRRATMEFLNIQDHASRDANAIVQRTVDSITSTLGIQRIDTTNRFEWYKAKDAPTFLRSVIFDMKMGFFNVLQFPLQAMSSFHATAVLGPTRGLPSLYNSWLMRAAMIRPDLAEGIGKYAGRLTPQQFKESFDMMQRLHWEHIGGEVGIVDDLFSQSMMPSKVEQMRETGRLFFTEGEKLNRLAGWNGAYLEWRLQNPNARFTEAVGRQLTARANTLSVNMLNSSNAAWQKGFLSIPAQFAAYPIRLMEQLLPFWSDRLTGWQKFSAFNTYGVLFGYPIATSGVVGVWPMHEEIRQLFLERGMDLDANVISKLWNQGILASMQELITGKDYSLGDRFGPSGTTMFSDVIKQKEGVWDFVLGATGSVVSDLAKDTMPFMYWAGSIFSDDDKRYPITQGDWARFFSNITTISNARKAWVAYNTGQYIAKNGTLLQDGMDGWDAMIIGLTGQQPSSVSDAFIMMESDKDLAKFQMEARKQVLNNLKAMYKAEDDETRHSYGLLAKQWYIAGGFRPDQAAGILRGSAEFRTFVDKAERDFMNRSPEHRKMFFDRIERNTQ